MTIDEVWDVSPALVGYTREDGDDGYEAVVFADADQQESFELQLADRFDEQDVRLGMDTYCLASTTIVGGMYGDPVRSWSARGGVATFVLNDDAAERFEARTWIYRCEPDALADVVAAIERIIGKPPASD